MIATGTTTREEADRLRDIIAEHALLIAREGEIFTLASGRQSKLYLDTKHATLAPEALLTIGKLFRQQAQQRGATAVGGLAAGAIPIVMAVIACEAIEGGTALRGFYVRSEAKTHGTREALFQAFDPGHPNGLIGKGTRVLVVDDVLTSGQSLGIATKAVQEREAEVAAIAVLVDRGEGGAAALRKDFGVPVLAIFCADADGNLTFHDGEVY